MRALNNDVEKIVKLVPHGSGVRMTREELRELLKLSWQRGASYYVERLMRNIQ